MTATVLWEVELTALSSIVHAGETRGTDTLLRRETVLTPTGPELVPVISGNCLRGRLRRIGEELLRDTLHLEGMLTLPAAYALRNGGSLHRSSAEPLSGRRRASIRSLIPQVGVFGCAAGSTIIDGALQVAKVVPQVRETEMLTGVASTMSAFDLVQLEQYSRVDDLNDHSAANLSSTADPTGVALPLGNMAAGNQMRYAVETFPAGTKLSTSLRLDRATDLEVAFFTDVLAEFATHGQLGGRLAIGHGRVAVHSDYRICSGWPGQLDWRAYLDERRDLVIEALLELQ